MTPLGQNIMRLMKERGISLPKLAIKADMDKGNLYRVVKEGRGATKDSGPTVTKNRCRL